VGLTLGLDGGRQTRVDASYGGKLGTGTTFHLGGFQRVGEGDREAGVNAAVLNSTLSYEEASEVERRLIAGVDLRVWQSQT
jgi:hypothetical protein